MNGVRIAGIIALTHWADRKLNIVDDHLLYGWGFFALVLLAAGYAGSFFADGEPDTPASKASHSPLRGCRRHGAATIVAGTPLVAGGFGGVYLGARATLEPLLHPSVSLESPSELQGWRKVPWSEDWSPAFPNADLQIRQSYARDGEVVDLFLAYYARQATGREMVAYGQSHYRSNTVERRAQRPAHARSRQHNTSRDGARGRDSGERTPLYLAVLLGGRRLHRRTIGCQASGSQGETFFRRSACGPHCSFDARDSGSSNNADLAIAIIPRERSRR